jgi:hypothetical protein
MARKPKKTVEDTATIEAVEAAETAIAVARSRGPRGTVETAVISLLVDANPKRAGSKAEAVFSNYRSGMTIAEFCDAVGKEATPNLVYDAAHGFIAIEGYDPEQVVKKEKAPKAEKAAKAPRAKKAKKEATVEETEAQTELDGMTVEESLD